MLETNGGTQESTASYAQAATYDWKWMLKTLLQRRTPTLLLGALCVALAVLYVQVRPSHYTASALLNITNLRLSSSDQNTFYTESLYDPTFLETQIQIIASEPIARAVIKSENLTAATNGDEQKALKAFRSSLSVLRVGQSNLAQISYIDSDPAKAASVANAVAKAYIEKLKTDRETSIQTASSWLRERLRGVGVQAQVVSEATPPVDKSDMRGILIIAAAGVVGAVAGMTLALVLGFFDRRIRTPEQAMDAAGVECLGMVPWLRAKKSRGRQPGPGEGQFSFSAAPPILSYVEQNPYTPLWQALRSAGAATPRTPSSPQRIAVTSTFAGEGKTTIAANLSLMAASSGRRVLLVDAQSYNPALSKMLAPQSRRGILEFLREDVPLSSLVLSDPDTGVDMLPFGTPGGQESGARLLWTSRMNKLFEQAQDYDLIVFDMPPLIATGDIRAAGAFLDNVLLVIGWKKVPADKLRAALALAAPIRSKLVGTLLNKARLDLIERWFSPEAAIMTQQARFAKAATRDAR